MTVKEAILKSLEDLNGVVTYLDVYNHIVKNKYCEFKGETPSSTVSAILGDFIRNGDTRVKRIKEAGGTYCYYLTKNEPNIGIDILTGSTETIAVKKVDKIESYEERDLHKLLCTYLKNTGIYSKTIFHEQSTYGKDNNQIWTHPDMVGIRFLKLQ